MSSAELPIMAPGFLSREHVLEATIDCCAEFGVGGATIRAIAEHLGCAVGSIYQYFDNKGELIVSAAQWALEPVAAGLDGGGATFANSVTLYVQQAAAHADLYRILFSGGVPPVVARIIDGWAGLLGDRESAARRWAMLHGLIVLGEEQADIIEAVTA